MFVYGDPPKLVDASDIGRVCFLLMHARQRCEDWRDEAIENLDVAETMSYAFAAHDLRIYTDLLIHGRPSAVKEA